MPGLKGPEVEALLPGRCQLRGEPPAWPPEAAT